MTQLHPAGGETSAGSVAPDLYLVDSRTPSRKHPIRRWKDQIEGSDLSHPAKCVGHVLPDFMDRDTLGRAFPGIERIRAILGYKTRQPVINGLRELVETGHLRKMPRNRRNHADEYQGILLTESDSRTQPGSIESDSPTTEYADQPPPSMHPPDKKERTSDVDQVIKKWEEFTGMPLQGLMVRKWRADIKRMLRQIPPDQVDEFLAYAHTNGCEVPGGFAKHIPSFLAEYRTREIVRQREDCDRCDARTGFRRDPDDPNGDIDCDHRRGEDPLSMVLEAFPGSEVME